MKRHRMRVRRFRRLGGEGVEERLCLSAIAFAAHNIECCAVPGANAVKAADLDGDHDVDVLSASLGRIAWYENMDGDGRFGLQELIDVDEDVRSIDTGDLDGDGDLDVLSASWNNVTWYENTDGKATFGPRRVIASDGRVVSSVISADLDSDGDSDVLAASWYDGKIRWYENTDGNGTFGEEHEITAQADHAWSIAVADVNGDGDMDVFSASYRDGLSQLAWYENIDGRGTFGSIQVMEQFVRVSILDARSVTLADLDGDGDMDVISAQDHAIAWYVNSDGQGTFGSRQVLTTEVVLPSSVVASDIDGDGDMDVLSASAWEYKGEVAWHENTDGRGTFRGRRVITVKATGAHSVAAADVDGDGDMDVLSASDSDWYDQSGKVAWYENVDAKGTFGDQEVISTRADGVRLTAIADVDADGDLDVISASSDCETYCQNGIIGLYENIDGWGTFGSKGVIAIGEGEVTSLVAADLDGDGDVDLLSAFATYDSRIVWYENTDGRGTFGPQRIILDEVESPRLVAVTDINSDGSPDVLAVSRTFYAWFENTDGRGTFGSQEVIPTADGNPQPLDAADLDGDGDIDVISTVGWYENRDGRGKFDRHHVIVGPTDGVYLAGLADIDGDGDTDAHSASTCFFRGCGPGEIAWYENDGNGTFSQKRVAATEDDFRFVKDAEFPLATSAAFLSVKAADIDGDGDLDLISGLSYQSGYWTEFAKIIWYENLNGRGDFGQHQTISTNVSETFSGTVNGDLDGDGDTDCVAAFRQEGRIAWYEQRLVGDANDDGVFNSADLVQIFQAGEYEDRGRYNSTYDEGDWNGDGDFTSADLVMAFQAGVYEAAARLPSTDLVAAIETIFTQLNPRPRPWAYLA